MNITAKIARDIKRRLKEIARQVEYAVGAEARRRSIESAIRSCQAEIHLLDVNLKACQSNFLAEIEQWGSHHPSVDLLPVAIESEVAKANGYFLGGLAAALIEIVFASIILVGFGLGWSVAIGVSSVLTALLVVLAHYAILFAAQHNSARKTLHQIKLFVLCPALILSVPAIAIVLLGRTVSGTLVIYLLPVLQSAMWIATLGLLLLGAALFAGAELYRWSEKRHKVYCELVRLRTLVVNVMHEYLDRLDSRTVLPCDQPGITGAPSRQAVSSGVGACVMLALFLISAALVGCGNPSSLSVATAEGPAASAAGDKNLPNTPAEPAAIAAVEPKTARDNVELHIEFDRSGSLQGEAWETAVHNLRQQLPDVIAASGATKLTISYFSSDGWMPLVRPPIQLPRLQTPDVTALQSGEFGSLPNVRQSIAERNKQEQATVMARAQVTYRAELVRALAGVNNEVLIPAGTPAAPCTDLDGVVRRAASATRETRHIYLILTDGYHTCGQMQTTPMPQSDVTVLALLIPAQAKESKGRRSVDQFFERREFLRRFVPWIKVVPAFEQDLAAYLGGDQSPINKQ